MITKERNVPILDAIIITPKNGKGLMVRGHDGKGHPLTKFISLPDALAAVEGGVAKKGWDDNLIKKV